jgi:hypothetical protein
MNLKDLLKQVKQLVYSTDEKTLHYKGKKARYSKGKFEAVDLEDAGEVLVIEEIKEGEPVQALDEAGSNIDVEPGFYLVETSDNEVFAIEVNEEGVIDYVEKVEEVASVVEEVADASELITDEMSEVAPEVEVAPEDATEVDVLSKLELIIDELIKKVAELEARISTSDEVITEYSNMMLKFGKKINELEKQPSTEKVIVEAQYSKNVNKSKVDMFAEIQKDVISKIKK